MASKIIEVGGVLREDGTLELDTRPELPPGRVQVALRAVEERPDVIEVLHRIHAEQAASGHVPRTREEIDADIEAMRQEDEERMQAIERLHEQCEQARTRPSSDPS